MQACPDETAFDWIRDGRRPFKSRKDPDWTGNFVSNVLPESFEAYVKVLHRIDARYETIDNPLSPSEIAILKIPPCEKLKSFVIARREQSLGTRVRWKDLANLLGVPFTPEINVSWYRKKLEDGWCWPAFLGGPSDAVLGDGCFDELISLLDRCTGDQSFFFRFSRWQFPHEDSPRMFEGVIEHLATFLETERYQFAPEYWWPGNQTWCVCSEYDLQFTLVGGPKGLISAVTTNAVLECIEVTPQTRIDYSAPMP
jgi:hypothetical protein